MRALPRGAGVIFRHYGTEGRRATGERVRAACRRRGVLFLVAGDARLAVRLKADGLHRPEAMVRGGWPPGLRSAAAHGRPGLVRAARAGADIAFLSPVFPSASHAGGRALTPLRFGLAARGARVAVIALGGMDGARFRRLAPLGARGWGAIDALTPPPAP